MSILSVVVSDEDGKVLFEDETKVPFRLDDDCLMLIGQGLLFENGWFGGKGAEVEIAKIYWDDSLIMSIGL